MYKIKDDEIEFMLNDIEKKGIITEDVRYNILDHVCCIIENEMPKGEDFKKFYRSTLARFYKNELSEIEDETRDLLTFKYYYAMKRTLKITGAMTAILIIIGALFKAFHLPGAGLALVLGLVLFSLVFIPLNIVMKFRDDKSKSNRLIMTLGFLTAAVGTLGILFKVMHWPGANMMVLGSLGIFLLVFIPVYFYSNFRNPETKFNAMIHSTFMIAACGMLFMLINIGPSLNIRESVESMYDFQDRNAIEMKANNDALLSEVSNSKNAQVDQIHRLTLNLSSKIISIKTNLIAKSDQISSEQAEGMSITDLNNPNDAKVIEEHFNQSEGDLNYVSLKQSVDIYNTGISALNEENVLRTIDIENLKMTETIISVVLHELGEIQMQLLSNENSFLSLSKGLLVER